MHQLALGGFWSLRSTQKEKLPAAAGVPPIVPLDESDSPSGSLPPMIEYW